MTYPESLNQASEKQRSPHGIFSELPIGELAYLSQVNWEKDYRNKNQHLIFHPNNRYETWLAHGAIPFAFRSFICDQNYIGRGELALYVKLTLMFDQYGICYTTYEDLASGMLSHKKQVQPLMTNLIERHMILRSPNMVKIPWLNKTAKARFVYQRPMAAYTVTRLHYLGFPEGEEGIIRKLSQNKFHESVLTLLQAYTSRPSDKKGKDAYNPLKHQIYQLDDDDIAGFKRILYDTFLTAEEKRHVPFVEDEEDVELLCD